MTRKLSAPEESTESKPTVSATVLLLRDDPFEVLMVSRAARGAFASALVFPGGAIDPEDASGAWRRSIEDFDGVSKTDRALRIGAIREVWEETGILLATADSPKRDGRGFREAVVGARARLRLDTLTHFGHWVTPLAESRRFDTHFYLAAVSRDEDSVPDGEETIATEWMAPARGVEFAQSGERPIIFPTMMNLMRLSESKTAAEAITAALERPAFTVAPVMETLPDGARRVTVPAEAGFSVTEWTERR